MTPSSLRVLMVAERLPPAIGGVERHIAGLARELARRGHSVTLLAPAHEPGLPPQTSSAGIHTLFLPHQPTRRRAYMQAWNWWLGRRAWLAEFDRIHFHEVYALLHLSAPLIALAPRAARSLTFHGYEMRQPISARARIYRRLAALLAPESLCVGHYLVKTFGLQPRAVIYGAVDSPGSIPALPESPSALFVGRLEADTGLDLYLSALECLQREYGVRLPLTVCGEGQLRLRLEARAKAANLPVTFLGAVSDPQAQLVGASLAFAPGYLAMLEAMASARPVFAAASTPVKLDYFRLIPGSSEMLFIAEDAPGLARLLFEVLCGKRDTAAQVQVGRRFAAQHTWSSLADQYLRLWGAA